MASLYRARRGRVARRSERSPGGAGHEPGPGGEGLIVASRTGPHESEARAAPRAERWTRSTPAPSGPRHGPLPLAGRRRGRPGRAVRGPQPPPSCAPSTSGEGPPDESNAAGGGLEILGTPQWTRQGLYYVVGKETTSLDDDGSEPLYDLLPRAAWAARPNPRPVWERTSSPRASASRPTAAAGRHRPPQPQVPTNLYVLDLATQKPRGRNGNEDMEIKTGPRTTWPGPPTARASPSSRAAPSRRNPRCARPQPHAARGLLQPLRDTRRSGATR